MKANKTLVNTRKVLFIAPQIILYYFWIIIFRLFGFYEDKLMHQISAPAQNRNMVCINESGLYSLILGSKLESAKEFKRWVTSEVLPSIRKHGAYMTDETI